MVLAQVSSKNRGWVGGLKSMLPSVTLARLNSSLMHTLDIIDNWGIDNQTRMIKNIADSDIKNIDIIATQIFLPKALNFEENCRRGRISQTSVPPFCSFSFVFTSNRV